MKIHVHWVNLMKNQIIQKFQSFEIKKKRLQGKTLIFLMIWQKKFNGFKMFNIRCKWCRSHVKEIILPKKYLIVH